MITGSKYGAYLKDPMPRRKGFGDKIWIAKGYHSMYFIYFYLSFGIFEWELEISF